jgi:hypothetical protein
MIPHKEKNEIFNLLIHKPLLRSIMDELVQRLSTGDHSVEASLHPEKTEQAFKECIERGYVHQWFGQF